jgi:hypothetical protein
MHCSRETPLMSGLWIIRGGISIYYFTGWLEVTPSPIRNQWGWLPLLQGPEGIVVTLLEVLLCTPLDPQSMAWWKHYVFLLAYRASTYKTTGTPASMTDEREQPLPGYPPPPQGPTHGWLRDGPNGTVVWQCGRQGTKGLLQPLLNF